MRFPGGEVVCGSAAANGEELAIEVGGREQRVRVVPGPWPEPLSELGGRAVKLARVERNGLLQVEPVVTTRDPDTGEHDLDTLRLIASYRDEGPDGEIYFARCGRVVEPGYVGAGDAVALA